MPQDLLSPAEFGQMLDDPAFAKLPFDTRKSYVEKGIGEASRFIAERDGGWTPERWQKFGSAAQQAREFVNNSETLTETGKRYAGVAGQTIKDLPAIFGVGALSASPVIPDGKPGMGINLQVPLETTGPALGRNIVSLAASGAAMMSNAEKPLVQKLDTLKQQIDAGDFLTHKDGFQGWIDQQHQAVKDEQTKFYDNKDWAEQNSLLGNPENVQLMQNYLATRSPESWRALQSNVLRSPFQAKLQGDKTRLETETKLGRALTPEAQPLISEAADPAEVVPGLLAAKKGMEAVAKGASKLSRAKDAAKGVLGEIAGEQVSATIDNPYVTAEQRLQIAKDSLAGALGLMGAGAGVQAVANRFSPTQPNAPLPSTQTATPPATAPNASAAAQMGATPAQTVSTLSRIAAESVAPEEDTGALTPEEVSSFRFQVSSSPQGMGQLMSDPSLTPLTPGERAPADQTAPDAIAGVTAAPPQTITGSNAQMGAEMPVPSPTAEAGAGTGAMERSPEAQAYSQALEDARLAEAARLRMIDNKAQGMPVIPDSPTGSRDILDFANENPIYLPPGFSEQRNLPEYENLKEAKLPQYWRQFIASGKRGGNPSTVAQRAFDAGFIAEPTADAYFTALREGIDGRKQYRAQFATREKALAAEEKQVVDFDKTQTKLAKKPNAQEVPFEDVLPGDKMTIDGEEAVVKNVEHNEDGYLTNVVIEDGKRFGLMQFDPQNRSGILVDEYQPQAARNQIAAGDFAPADTAPASLDSLLQGTESTRPRNVGETARSQNADPLGELMGAKLAGEAEQAQGKMEPLLLPKNFTGNAQAGLAKAAAQNQSLPQRGRGAAGQGNLLAAYQSAARGSSTQMLPIRAVYEQAKAQNPALTPAQFMQEVQAGDAAGTVLLDVPENPATLQAAGAFVLRNALGVPSTGMMVQDLQALQNPANDKMNDWANRVYPLRRAIAAEIQQVPLPASREAGVSDFLVQLRDYFADRASNGHLQDWHLNPRIQQPIYRADYARNVDEYYRASKELIESVRQVTQGRLENITAGLYGNANTLSNQPGSALRAQAGQSSQAGAGALQSQESLASRAELKAAQAANESKLKALGLPTKPGTRIWARGAVGFALKKIAADSSYPATMRAMADLLAKVDLNNLLLKIEGDARLSYAGKYQPLNAGRGEISLNTRVTGRGDTDIVQSLVHELLHHATFRALRSPKNATQKGAIADLEALRKRALAALSAQELGRQFDYELSNTDEFIAALFTRADFQTALAGIPHEAAPKSLSQRVRSVLDEIFRVLGELVTGKTVQPGSVLEASMSATLRLMGEGQVNVQARLGNAILTHGPGPVTILQRALRAVKAYHGTPHKVDKFTTGKIGTGEGAQAYGWGLYFAQGKAVAENYRKVLVQKQKIGKAAPLTAKEDVQRIFLNLGDIDEVKNTVRSEIVIASSNLIEAQRNPDTSDFTEAEATRELERWQAALRYINDNYDDLKGNLYTVELLPNEDEFLDWDKPLSEQEAMVKAVNKAMQSVTGQNEYFQGVRGDLPGSWLYHAAAKAVAAATGKTEDFSRTATANEAKLASEALAKVGIPGIRYLDQGSRASSGGKVIGVWQGKKSTMEDLGTGEWYARIQVDDRSIGFQNSPTTAWTTSMPFKSKSEAQAWANEKVQSGTRNFVVFDEKHIRITEENGQPVQGWDNGPELPALLNPAAAPNETQSRFASPNAADRVINGPRTDVQVAAEAAGWLATVDELQAIEAFQTHQVPLSLDAQEHAAGLLIARLSNATTTGKTEVLRMWAHVQSQRMARIWTKEYLSADPARALRQRAVVNNTILQPIAPILAAQDVLIDRAEALGKARFDGGWTALVQKINDLLKRIEALTAGTAAQNIAKGESTPGLKAMLNALRKKMYPGMDWTEIFTDLPSTQKARQLAIYDRLMKDERLQGLTQEERIALTNELDKAWMRERRTVFNRELTKAGILGEKNAGDRQKVKNAMPRLLRLINLGMFNSEMFREVIAPEYKLRVIDAKTAATLRGLAEAAYAQPEGVLRNRKLGDLLNAMQSATGSTVAELVNNYWTAAVLSGTRTQFDTWMAGVNGLGTNMIQAAGLLARGRGKDAVAAHAAWWRGFNSGFWESLQILAKGDYSMLKRFGADLNKALQGESGFRPLPLGESLWKNGNTFQKYAMAPVMIWTGRLMAAADHINNTATTSGAMAVARALHPEYYGRTSFSEIDQANARAQALREVTGGTPPTTAADRATVSVRVRELLYGSMRETERLEANEIGDMAAFQNDPTGLFGGVYAILKGGLGMGQRLLEGEANDVQANKAYRAIMGLMAGSLHGLTGTRFMRFGFNFGAEITRYVPGTALMDIFSSRKLYGKDTGPMQRELLIGKNVVGLMLGSTLAALFLSNDDDDDKGLQIEGDWSGLTPQQVKERMSAGYERMTIRWRDGDKVRRVSYKQWPTMGLFAVVGGMLDEKRHKPDQWAQHGTTGHLIRGMATGLLQIKNVSAMRNLVEIFGGSRLGGDPSTGMLEDLAKIGTNFAGGMVPTVMKDAEVWTDPRNFKAEGWLEELQRATPIARRFVNDGRPQLNLLGEEVKLQRAPWSRGYTSVESSEASRVLGALLGRGLALPQPSDAVMVYQNGVKVPLEKLGREKVWQYEKAVGTAYKQWLATEGSALLQMPVKQADKVIEQRAGAIKRQALARVTR